MPVLEPETINDTLSRLPVKFPSEKREGDPLYEKVSRNYQLVSPLQDENLQLTGFIWDQYSENGRVREEILFMLSVRDSQTAGLWRQCYIDMKRDSGSSPQRPFDWSFAALTSDIFYCNDTSFFREEESSAAESAAKGVATLLGLPL